ncbi:alpha/beta hydrolase [Curtobacterium sp. Leaf261]|uniref:alpha/beta hydrolase n=1 Tax=Curtobacterium sp. Leaf261 TaxID=1736311 RepID=UPI000A7C65FB|nr:alpha/beta hydrolase [Curtobacterium sp. Leaf261]
MAERLIDTSDLPRIDASSDAVSGAAQSLRDSTADMERAGQDAVRAWSGIGGVLDSPGATDALPKALHPLSRRTATLAHVGSAVAGALDTFADELTTLKRSRAALLADVEELRSRVVSKSVDGTVPPEYEPQNDDLHDRADRLATRWQTAQNDLTETLQSHTAGDPLTGPMLAGGFSPLLLAPVDFSAAVRGFQDAARLPLLAELAAQGRPAVERWLRDHPAERQRLIDDPPDASAVRGWWDGLGADERSALVLGASTIVGNLDGVLYADRGRANQHTIDVELPKARSRYETLSARIGRGEQLSTTENAEYARLASEIGALTSVQKALHDGSPLAPRTVVSLTLGHPPLAAIAIGDMDTASRVTVDVPGMGNTVADSMRGWTGGAQNLYDAQRTAARRIHVDVNVATVAWMGYDTPDMPPSAQVLSSTKAKAGAANLSDFLSGVSDTRSWSGGENLSVVGHSYGTTTATLATTKTPVSNVTLLASAGIDSSVPNATALDVPVGHVWTSQSKADYIANIGRGSIETALPFGHEVQPSTGGPSPTRSTVLDFWSAHPLNPADADWGARTFSSNEERIDGVDYPGSDGHSATPATDAALSHQDKSDNGYLDYGTSSLRNTAYTTLGYTPGGERIP